VSIWWLVVALGEARAAGDVERVRVLEATARVDVALALRPARRRFPPATRVRRGFVVVTERGMT
jgi:hypothetical protein